jgi:phosphate transport system substrate-binding protein
MTTTAAAATTAATTTTAAAMGGAMSAPAYASLKGTLAGSGSSLIDPVMQPWIKAFAGIASNANVSYTKNGSGAGRKDFFGGNTNFAVSDVAPSDKELSDYGKKVLYFPMTIAGVVIVYNLPGVDKLKLDADTVGKIYTGQIKKWNDPAIAALNSGAKLPDTAISFAVRQDTSGTTGVFTSYLAAISSDFKTKVGGSTQAPDGWGKVGLRVTQGNGNDGVAGLVKQTEGTIGYVEVAYALANKLTYVSLKNQAGNFVDPTLDNLSAAAAGAKPSDTLILDLINQADPNAWPITTTTYGIVNVDQTDADKAATLVAFLYWATHDGQDLGPKYNYAKLPAAIVTADEKQLGKVMLNGQPVMK